MQILKYMKRENSGLARTTLEHAKFEERLGHQVAVREPQGQLLWGRDFAPDVVTVHSQLSPDHYHTDAAKIFLCHGEPLSSVANGISFKAVVDLASMMDAFICMRKAELDVWKMVKQRTYYVPKGVDLDVFTPINGVEKLEGEPSVLVYENIRGIRNPLYIVCAMQKVFERYPKARLHLYNVNDEKMKETFSGFVKHSKLWTYVRSMKGAVKQNEVPALLNSADIVVSGLYPLSARGIESLACGKAYVSAGYDGGDGAYPWIVPEYSVQAFADTITQCWENYDSVNYRAHAERYHDEAESSKQRCAIYAKYL